MTTGDGTTDLQGRVGEIIRAWVSDKFAESENGTVIRRSRRPAQFELNEDHLGERHRLILRTFEDASGLQFETETRVLLEDGRLLFRSEVLTGQGEGYLNASTFAARPPRFFGDILALPARWHFAEGGDRFLARVHQVRPTEINLLEDLLTRDDRRLPITLVSTVDGAERFDGLSTGLHQACMGLAHVCRVDEAVSWALTERFGEKWSCFGQAVRVFWPRTFLSGSPFSHPLHLAERMPEPCGRAVDQVVRPLIEGSSFLGGYPSLQRFEADLARARLDVALEASRADADYGRLEDLYAKPNDELRHDNARLQAEVDELRSRLEAAAAGSSVLSDQVEALATVVADFQTRHRGLLQFADDWAKQIQSINPDGFAAGDLERCLDLLLEMAAKLRDNRGSLGKAIHVWCRDRGVDCSGESETKKGSGLYSWRVAGRDEEFELHLKPTDRKPPDRCVRIYFKPSADFARVMVGYIGSKKGID